MRKFWSYFAAYALWVVALALGVVFIAMARQAWPLMWARAITPGPNYYMLNQQVRLGSQVLMVILGGVWMIAAVLLEDRGRAAVRKGRLGRYAQRVLGPELLLLTAMGLILRIGVGPGPADLLVWPALTVLLIVGVALTVGGYTTFRLSRGGSAASSRRAPR